MRPKNNVRAMLEDLLLERGVRLSETEGVGEFIDELDDLIEELTLVRVTVVAVEGTCGNPDCPVHGVAASKPAASDPFMN